MKLGIKLWSTNPKELLKQAVDMVNQQQIDFIELNLSLDKSGNNNLYLFKEITISLHAPHEGEGINLAQPDAHFPTIFKKINEIYQELNINYLIVHPGVNGSLKNIKKNLSKIKCNNILIENMPVKCLKSLGGGICHGATLAELKDLINPKYHLCLDFGHAIKASIAQQIPYKKYIEKLLRFNPVYFHLSDGSLSHPYDEHLNLGEGEYDLLWIKKLLCKINDPYIVFETPKEGNFLKNDLKNIKYFKNL